MTVETLRHILILGGFMIIGLNLAVIAEAPRLVNAVASWRLYMSGQCFFDAAAIYGLHKHLHSPIGWTVCLTGAAVALTLASLVMLERAHRYKLSLSRLNHAPHIPHRRHP